MTAEVWVLIVLMCGKILRDEVSTRRDRKLSGTVTDRRHPLEDEPGHNPNFGTLDKKLDRVNHGLGALGNKLEVHLADSRNYRERMLELVKEVRSRLDGRG